MPNTVTRCGTAAHVPAWQCRFSEVSVTGVPDGTCSGGVQYDSAGRGVNNRTPSNEPSEAFVRLRPAAGKS